MINKWIIQLNQGKIFQIQIIIFQIYFFNDFYLKIILEHSVKSRVVIDFKREAVDYRFSRALFRATHLYEISCKDENFWPVLLVENSSYLKKINDEEADFMLAVWSDLKHYLIFDGDYLVDVIAGKNPDIYFEKE